MSVLVFLKEIKKENKINYRLPIFWKGNIFF